MSLIKLSEAKWRKYAKNYLADSKFKDSSISEEGSQTIFYDIKYNDKKNKYGSGLLVEHIKNK